MNSHTATPSASPTLETGKKFVLLFSGGLDSTLEVVERMKTHREAHLLTFNNGYCVNTQGSLRRASEMKDRFGANRIIDSLINTKPLMQTILEDFKALWREYRSPLIVDMGCKMASVTELILYAKNNDIEEISDGASVDQTQVFIQHPEFSAHIKPLISSHGLRFLRPVLFDIGREEKIAMLKELGFERGSKTLEKLHITSQLKHQPFCLIGFSTFFFTSPLRKIPLVQRYDLPMDRAKELWDALLPRATAYLNARLAEE